MTTSCGRNDDKLRPPDPHHIHGFFIHRLGGKNTDVVGHNVRNVEDKVMEDVVGDVG